jgi:hypothetical protein
MLKISMKSSITRSQGRRVRHMKKSILNVGTGCGGLMLGLKNEQEEEYQNTPSDRSYTSQQP